MREDAHLLFLVARHEASEEGWERDAGKSGQSAQRPSARTPLFLR